MTLSQNLSAKNFSVSGELDQSLKHPSKTHDCERYVSTMPDRLVRPGKRR